MRSHHAPVDRATARVGSVLVGDDGFFARNVAVRRVDEVISDVAVAVPSLAGETLHEISANTPAGSLGCAGGGPRGSGRTGDRGARPVDSASIPTG